MNSDSAVDPYEEDPSLLDPAGPVERVWPDAAKPRLGGAIPIRFSPETIAKVKEVAQAEGLTVSSWIRHEIEQVLESKSRPVSSGTERRAIVLNWSFVKVSMPQLPRDEIDREFWGLVGSHA